MNKNLAIQVNNLGKHYSLGERAPYLTLRDALVGVLEKKPRKAKSSVWALKGVGLQVAKGEVVGIIGRNGAGKSTLLKILSQITEPSVGMARIRGRVGSLLEVGTGFNQELTGRENIYLNGSILGMKRREIKAKFDEIVEFSGVEKFIDTPVKRYSSGMYVRLAFSVAAHLEPEVLLVDEVLAVGDVGFQKKCLGVMRDVTRSGRTVLFVSHNMAAVANLCERSVLLEAGKVVADGATSEVIEKYYKIVGDGSKQSNGGNLRNRTDRQGSGEVKVAKVKVKSLSRDRTIKTGDRLEVVIEYDAVRQYKNGKVNLSFLSQPHELVLFRFKSENTLEGVTLSKKGKLVCTTEPVNVTAGAVSVNVSIYLGGVMADYVMRACEFDIIDGNYLGYPAPDDRSECPMLIRHTWKVK